MGAARRSAFLLFLVVGGAPLPSPQAGCTPAPAGVVTDFGARGPFATRTLSRSGPGGEFTLFLPATLGEDGFRHPIATWGNGMSTTPDDYRELLETIASHGFVVIASNSPRVTPQLMRRGLTWLVQQNDAPGEFQGRLAPACGAALGHSRGGGAAVTAGSHSSVVAVVSLHGVRDPAAGLRGPLLLLTSTNDGVASRSGSAQPTFDASTTVPTLMATLDVPGVEPGMAGHLVPMRDAGPERAPTVAWLRSWVYGDAGARKWFYGSDCVLCEAPWTDIQRKNADWNYGG